MLRKILAMSWKEIYTTYTDRNLLLIMIATPLALATIIGLAFSGFLNSGGNDVPIQDVPFALVNLDEETTGFGGAQNMGQVFVDLLVEGAADDQPEVLLELTNAELMTDPDEARRRVDTGELAAAVAHQINNPLTTIVLDTELMMLNEKADTPQYEQLEQIHGLAEAGLFQ